MESGNNKYINNRNSNVYVYSCCRTVCHNSNDGYCCDLTHHTNVQPVRAAVSELITSCTSNYNNQYHQRNLESCVEHSNNRNSNVYVYSCCRTVCHNSNDGYCCDQSDHTSLQTGRAAVSELNTSCTSNYIQ